MAVTMTWTVEVTVRLGPPASDPDLGDRLLSELVAVAAAMSPVVAQDTVAGTVNTMLTVPDIDDPDDALAAGRNAVHVAIERLNLPSGIRSGPWLGDEVALSVTAVDDDHLTHAG